MLACQQVIPYSYVHTLECMCMRYHKVLNFCGLLKTTKNTKLPPLVNFQPYDTLILITIMYGICDRLWEKGPLGSGDQFLFYCSIGKSSFCAFNCTLEHNKLSFPAEVIAFYRIGIMYKV